MPLYELLVISSHFKELVHVRDLVKTTASHLMQRGGVVRSIGFWETRLLPQRLRSHKQWHLIGDYWTLHFDASPSLMGDIRSRLREDPRVIRQTVLKMGEKLEDIAEIQHGKTMTGNGYGGFFGHSKA